MLVKGLVLKIKLFIEIILVQQIFFYCFKVFYSTHINIIYFRYIYLNWLNVYTNKWSKPYVLVSSSLHHNVYCPNYSHVKLRTPSQSSYCILYQNLSSIICWLLIFLNLPLYLKSSSVLFLVSSASWGSN